MAPLEKEPAAGIANPSAQDKYQDALSLIEKDNKAKRNEYLFETPGFVTKWLDKALRDPRDKPMVFLMYNMVSAHVARHFLKLLNSSHDTLKLSLAWMYRSRFFV
jgi:hypothetical protein